MSECITLVFLLNLWSLEISFSTLQMNLLCMSLRRETHSSGVYRLVLRFVTFLTMRSRYTTGALFGRSEVTSVNDLRPSWLITGHYCAIKVRSLVLVRTLVEVPACGVSYVSRAYVLTHTHTYMHAYIHTYMHAYIHTCIRTCIPRSIVSQNDSRLCSNSSTYNIYEVYRIITV